MGARISFAVVALALAPGCFASVDGGAAYVVADLEARNLGTTVGGEALPVRPVIVASGEIEIARSGEPPERVRIETGDVVAVRGVRLIRFAPAEVRPDAIAVRATEADARALAGAVEADVAREGERFLLVGPDVFQRMAALPSDPAGVTEMTPVPIGPALEAASDATERSVRLDDLAERAPVVPLVSPSPIEAEAVRLLEASPFELPNTTPFAFRTGPLAPGRFAMRLAHQREFGCSRGGSHTSTSGAFTLDVQADGRASACAAYRSRNYVYSAERDDTGLIRTDSFERASRMRAGYRGAWRTLDDGAIGVALVRDDTSCSSIAEGAPPRGEPLLLRCVAASGTDAARNVGLPGSGLACAIVRDAYAGTFEPSVENILYLGPGEGWDVRSHDFRWDSVLEVVLASAPIDPLAL